MRTILTGLGLVLSLTIITSTGEAQLRLRVVKTKAGPAFQLGGDRVSFSAVQRGQQRLGPYMLEQNKHTKQIEAKRSWAFGKTKAQHTRSYEADGTFFGWGRATGELKPGHHVRTIGHNQKNGRCDWKLETKENPFQFLMEGTNSKGPLKYSRVQSGPYGTFAKNVFRDGRVEQKYQPPKTAIALPAPKAKPALSAPKAKPLLPAPEAKLGLPAPKAKPLLPAPEAKLGLPAPKAKLGLPAPKAKPLLTGPAPRPLLIGPAPRPLLTGPGPKLMLPAPEARLLLSAPKK